MLLTLFQRVIVQVETEQNLDNFIQTCYFVKKNVAHQGKEKVIDLHKQSWYREET